MGIDASRAGLLEAVTGHRPADATEAEHRDRFVALLTECDAPFSRATSAGHVTASVFLTPSEGSAVLLLWHEKLGRWLQPGGHCEAGDTSVVAAAARELEEETGASAAACTVRATVFDLDVHLIPPRGGEPGHYHYDVRFHFILTTPADLPPTGGFRWASTDDPVYSRGDESLARCFRKLRALAGT